MAAPQCAIVARRAVREPECLEFSPFIKLVPRYADNFGIWNAEPTNDIRFNSK
jgi:hypothetical protein